MPDAPLLLTPGPLTTAESTRAPMAIDHGSRDPAFVALSNEIRSVVVALVGDPDALVCVPIQGSGTFAVEATLGTLVPRSGKVLVLVNGAYGRRMVQICQTIGRDVVWLETPEHVPNDLDGLDRALANDADITHVAAVHCETTTGLLNPIAAISGIVASHGRRLIVDAMSAFGALPLHGVDADAIMASSNKCLEGVPGVGFAVVKREVLDACEGRAHSVALDLHAQQQRFDEDGQWRFTPPTHVLAALHAAVQAHGAEGGVEGRGDRYARNHATLIEGMRALGFATLLPDHLQAPIIVTFLDPAADAYDFGAFYEGLQSRGFVIYPGKLTVTDTFRVGCIGQVFPDDMHRFLGAVREVMDELGIRSGTPDAGSA